MLIDGKRSSDRSTELVLGYYAAFNRGDWDGMCALLDENVVHEINQGERERGREAFRAFLRRMAGSYREQLRDLAVMTTADGTRAGAEYIVEGEYLRDDVGMPAAHGQRYVLPGGAFFDVVAGRIARVSNYYNLTDWLRQIDPATARPQP